MIHNDDLTNYWNSIILKALQKYQILLLTRFRKLTFYQISSSNLNNLIHLINEKEEPHLYQIFEQNTSFVILDAVGPKGLIRYNMNTYGEIIIEKTTFVNLWQDYLNDNRSL